MLNMLQSSEWASSQPKKRTTKEKKKSKIYRNHSLKLDRRSVQAEEVAVLVLWGCRTPGDPRFLHVPRT